MSSDRYAARSGADVVRLVLEHPLAWIVSFHDDDFRATLLPLRPEVNADGELVRLLGHFARSNDHHRLLLQRPRAAILTLGAQGYISPSWIHDKTWGPTWNYASAQFLVNVHFDEDPQFLDEHLHDLVRAMEADRPNPWSIEEMGARYASLAKRVIGFRAEVLHSRARFKLGQDERDEVFRDITFALSRTSQDDLLTWMKAFNPARGE